MARVKFELNLPGLRELMKSEPMQKIVQQNVESIADEARNMSGGLKYDSAVRLGSFDSIGTVYPASAEAARDNYENNTLLKALGSSGLPRTK